MRLFCCLILSDAIRSWLLCLMILVMTSWKYSPEGQAPIIRREKCGLTTPPLVSKRLWCRVTLRLAWLVNNLVTNPLLWKLLKATHHALLRVPPCLFTKQRLGEDPLHWRKWNRCPGARFSKVLIINGPSKLYPFALKIEVSTVLHLTW